MTWQIYTKEIRLPYKKRIIIHIFPIKIKLYFPPLSSLFPHTFLELFARVSQKSCNFAHRTRKDAGVVDRAALEMR